MLFLWNVNVWNVLDYICLTELSRIKLISDVKKTEQNAALKQQQQAGSFITPSELVDKCSCLKQGRKVCCLWAKRRSFDHSEGGKTKLYSVAGQSQDTAVNGQNSVCKSWNKSSREEVCSCPVLNLHAAVALSPSSILFQQICCWCSPATWLHLFVSSKKSFLAT